MNNTNQFTGKDYTQPWHIGAQAFVAILIVLIVPLTVNVKNSIASLIDGPKPAKVAKVEKPKSNNSLTRFLGAAVFGVGDESIITDPETGTETIILPYGGESESGGTLPGSGNIDADRWVGAPPATDGSVSEIRTSRIIRNTGGEIPVGNGSGGGSTNSGGSINAGGTIQAGGSI